MAYTAPTTEPAALRSGDTWQWTPDLGDYPADAWTLTYYFRNATAHFDIVATADGTGHVVSMAKAATAVLVPGWYEWTAFVSTVTERYQVGSGRTEVLPDLAANTAFDARSFARKMLDAIEAALLDRATTDQLDLMAGTFGDRSITRDKDRLNTERARYRTEAAREENPGQRGGRLLVRFG
jgi:hypothetical protein